MPSDHTATIIVGGLHYILQHKEYYNIIVKIMILYMVKSGTFSFYNKSRSSTCLYFTLRVTLGAAWHYLTNQPPFTKASRSLRGACLREGFAEPPRRLHEPSSKVYEPFAEVAYTEGSTKTPWRVHEASYPRRVRGWTACSYSMVAVIIVLGQYYTVFFTRYASNIGELISTPWTVFCCCSHRCSHLNDLTFFSPFEWMLTGITLFTFVTTAGWVRYSIGYYFL